MGLSEACGVSASANVLETMPSNRSKKNFFIPDFRLTLPQSRVFYSSGAKNKLFLRGGAIIVICSAPLTSS
jgi:hypothetical protein